jgi:hypothetical protein
MSFSLIFGTPRGSSWLRIYGLVKFGGPSRIIYKPLEGQQEFNYSTSLLKVIKKFSSQSGCNKKLIMGKVAAKRMWVILRRRKRGKTVTRFPLKEGTWEV